MKDRMDKGTIRLDVYITNLRKRAKEEKQAAERSAILAKPVVGETLRCNLEQQARRQSLVSRLMHSVANRMMDLCLNRASVEQIADFANDLRARARKYSDNTANERTLAISLRSTNPKQADYHGGKATTYRMYTAKLYYIANELEDVKPTKPRDFHEYLHQDSATF